MAEELRKAAERDTYNASRPAADDGRLVRPRVPRRTRNAISIEKTAFFDTTASYARTASHARVGVHKTVGPYPLFRYWQPTVTVRLGFECRFIHKRARGTLPRNQNPRVRVRAASRRRTGEGGVSSCYCCARGAVDCARAPPTRARPCLCDRSFSVLLRVQMCPLHTGPGSAARQRRHKHKDLCHDRSFPTVQLRSIGSNRHLHPIAEEENMRHHVENFPTSAPSLSSPLPPEYFPIPIVSP